MKYYTTYNVDITQRIKDGRTFLFEGTDDESREKAEKKANSIRTYVFDVYAENKNNKKREFIGFAVPK